MVEFQSVFCSCQPWAAPVLLSRSEHPRVPLTRGHPQNYNLFLLLQRCYCSADRGLQKGCFPRVFFMVVVVPGPPIMCFHFCCTVFFQFASFQVILICHEKRNMNSDSENCYHWPDIVPRVLFSVSAGNNVFDLMLGDCPKNSLNLCPSSAIHYWVWIYVGEALRGSFVLSLSLHSTNILSHTWLGKGWAKPSSLHAAAASSPAVIILLWKWILVWDSFMLLLVCSPVSIPQSSRSAGITQGASAQLKGAVSVQAGQEPSSALTMSNKPCPAARKVCLF